MILFAALVANAFAAALWQGILLAVLVALCLRLLPGLSAAARSFIWTTVFAAALLLHFLPILRFSSAAPSETVSPSLHLAPAWSLCLLALWLTLSIIRAIQLLLSARAFHRVARSATLAPIQPSPAFTLCTSPHVDRPSVLGFFHSRILLPPALLASLSSEDLYQVLLHETEHLRRRDAWTNLLQKLALVVFPLNPALLWIEHRLCLERELACDDHVLAQTRAPRAYATCLITLAEHSILRRGLSLALGVLGRESELSRRVHRILRAPERRLGPRQTSALTASFVLALIAGSLTLAHAPQLISFNLTQPREYAWESKLVVPQPAKSILATYMLSPSNRTVPLSSQPHRDERVDAARPILATQKLPPRKKRIPQSHSALRALAPSVADQDIPRLVLTSAPVGQFSYTFIQTVFRVPAYAAVATPNGWIILQL